MILCRGLLVLLLALFVFPIVCVDSPLPFKAEKRRERPVSSELECLPDVPSGPQMKHPENVQVVVDRDHRKRVCHNDIRTEHQAGEHAGLPTSKLWTIDDSVQLGVLEPSPLVAHQEHLIHHPRTISFGAVDHKSIPSMAFPRSLEDSIHKGSSILLKPIHPEAPKPAPERNLGPGLPINTKYLGIKHQTPMDSETNVTSDKAVSSTKMLSPKLPSYKTTTLMETGLRPQAPQQQQRDLEPHSQKQIQSNLLSTPSHHSVMSHPCQPDVNTAEPIAYQQQKRGTKELTTTQRPEQVTRQDSLHMTPSPWPPYPIPHLPPQTRKGVPAIIPQSSAPNVRTTDGVPIMDRGTGFIRPIVPSLLPNRMVHPHDLLRMMRDRLPSARTSGPTRITTVSLGHHPEYRPQPQSQLGSRSVPVTSRRVPSPQNTIYQPRRPYSRHLNRICDLGQFEAVQDGEAGRGGFGSIYQVRDRIGGEVFVMKHIKAKLVQTKSKLITNEETIHYDLDHPNIVRFHCTMVSPDTGDVYFLLEHVVGRNLAEYVGDLKNAASVGEVGKIIGQVSLALHYLHGRSVAHRDVKLANIMLMPSGNVRLLDFGLAVQCAKDDLTECVGTAQNAAPEVFRACRGQGTYGRAADYYSLGTVAYALRAREHLHQGEDAECFERRLHSEEITEVPSTKSAYVDELLQLLLNEDQHKRWLDVYFNSVAYWNLRIFGHAGRN